MIDIFDEELKDDHKNLKLEMKYYSNFYMNKYLYAYIHSFKFKINPVNRESAFTAGTLSHSIPVVLPSKSTTIS